MSVRSVISREEARAAGLFRYFTGKPCKNGHAAERFVSNSACSACNEAWAKANPEKVRKRVSRWADANKEVLRNAQRRWREANREKERERSRSWNAANRASRNAKARERYAANREKEHERQGRYREANRETTRKASRRWNKTPAGKASKAVVRYQRRDAAQELVPGVTRPQIERLMALADHCHYCGRKFSARLTKTLEHVIPLAKGGEHKLSNLTIACRSCNSAKGARLTMLL